MNRRAIILFGIGLGVLVCVGPLLAPNWRAEAHDPKLTQTLNSNVVRATSQPDSTVPGFPRRPAR
jgi:hypothetical protein